MTAEELLDDLLNDAPLDFLGTSSSASADLEEAVFNKKVAVLREAILKLESPAQGKLER
jgi:hypothetical protein